MSQPQSQHMEQATKSSQQEEPSSSKAVSQKQHGSEEKKEESGDHDDDVRNLAIIGAGPAGVTAAIYAARANLHPIMFSGIKEPSQIAVTTTVENFPGFPDGVSGPDLLDSMQSQAEKYGAEVIMEDVVKIDFDERPFTITHGFSGENTTRVKALIMATGAVARTLHVPGADKFWGRNVSSCAVCDSHLAKDKITMVIGGGDAAVEEALYLSKFAKEVLLVHRRDELRASFIMQKRLFESNVKIIWNAVVTEMIGDKLLERVKLKNTKDDSEWEQEVGALFYGIGHIPSSSLVTDVVEMDKEGYIKVGADAGVRSGSQATSCDGIFACGDVSDKIYRQAICAAGQGAAAAIEAEHWLMLHEDD